MCNLGSSAVMCRGPSPLPSTTKTMRLIVYWFRNDLRLEDNPAFSQACVDADVLLPIVIHDTKNDLNTPWGFKRLGQCRRQFEHESITALKIQLQSAGSDLFVLKGSPVDVIAETLRKLGAHALYTQKIEAPEENQDIERLKAMDVAVREFWQSSMLDPADLPFELANMPESFSRFRQRIEAAKLTYATPVAKPTRVPPLPKNHPESAPFTEACGASMALPFKGGAQNALNHIDQYFLRRLPDTYKKTRNQLMGMDYSSKFSPWLALGCCSARSIAHRLNAYEQQFGANEGTYWLWFELLWRDYFEFLAFKYGKKLFRARGLSDRGSATFDARSFDQWITGQTENSFINAGMTELSQTGYLSNRMRQIVASYWIYDMQGDWRAGASWFESQLIDYDVYSNVGNWLYIAGRGTDPRGGRHFNVVKQALEHDPDNRYQHHWLKTPL